VDAATTTSAITITLLLAALGLKVTDFVKFATNALFGSGDKKKQAVNDITTFLLSWAIGIGAVTLLARTAWGDEVTIGKETLAALNFGNLIVFGLVFSTVSGTLYDFKKAIDGGDTAKKAPLIPSTPPQT
jgi:hypothetical protein